MRVILDTARQPAPAPLALDPLSPIETGPIADASSPPDPLALAPLSPITKETT